MQAKKSTLLAALIVAMFSVQAQADGFAPGEGEIVKGSKSNGVVSFEQYKAKSAKAARAAAENNGFAVPEESSKVAANKYPTKDDVFGSAASGMPTSTRSPFLDTKQAVYQYDPNESYPVLARTNMFTQIDLPEGAKVDGFYLSDTDEENWVHYVSKDERHIFIQALKGGLFNSGSIISGNNTFLLAINSSDSGNWFQRVKWVMPKKFTAAIAKPATTADKSSLSQAQKSKFFENYEEPAKAPVEVIKGVNADELNTKWKIDGDAAFRPLSVYNDDEFTWLELPPKMSEMPALFSISASGVEPELVNYTLTESGRYKVNKVLTGGLLKLGKSEVKLTNLNVKQEVQKKSGTAQAPSIISGNH